MNECKLDGDLRCKEGAYCYNTPGSFRCNGESVFVPLTTLYLVTVVRPTDCDKACKKICNGPGPAKCAVCAVGYTESDHGVCRGDDSALFRVAVVIIACTSYNR